MKKQILTSLFVLLATLTFAQKKIETTQTKANLGGANHEAIAVVLPGTSVDQVAKAWKSEVKKWGGKIAAKKNEINSDNATTKQLGENSFDVYAVVLEDKDAAAKLVIGIDLGGAFLNASDHPEKYKYVEKFVREFAVKTVKGIIGEELKSEEKALSKLNKTQADLEKSNEKLHKDIEDYKKKIEKAEADIEKNVSEQEKNKKAIETQSDVVKAVSKKQSGIQ